MQEMQWLFDIIIKMMENAGFIRIGDVELYLKGMIVIWSGNFNDIPDGWALCNGTNGTPDLRSRFVWGAPINAVVGVAAGELTHAHDFTGDGHSHHLPLGDGIAGGVLFSTTSSSDPAVGTTDLTTLVPPFMYLAFIMKL